MIQNITKPFRWFFKLEAASGLVLLFSAVIALIISNSDLSSLYFGTLEKYIFIGVNSFGIKLSVLHWINDALMAIFFFFVTLEIKREFLQGELSNIKQALLPIIGAVGGMLVPALFYVFINYGDSETIRGWAIPSATDIAFSLGVLSLLGSRVPISLKVFLTALAIIDDLGAIVIIAIITIAPRSSIIANAVKKTFNEIGTLDPSKDNTPSEKAFSLGVLSLLGSRVPISLKVFLTALAIIDDLGAIVIIAIITIAPRSSIIANAVKKTFNEIGTLDPSKDNTPSEKAISVAEGIAHPLIVSLSP